MTPAVPDPTAEALSEREALGRLVREVWIEWAQEQPNPKPSWLVPWEGLSETDREVDRRIGERLAAEHTERAVREALEAAAVRVEAAGLGADFGRQYDGNESPDAALHHAHDEGLQEAARIVREGGADYERDT